MDKALHSHIAIACTPEARIKKTGRSTETQQRSAVKERQQLGFNLWTVCTGKKQGCERFH